MYSRGHVLSRPLKFVNLRVTVYPSCNSISVLTIFKFSSHAANMFRVIQQVISEAFLAGSVRVSAVCELSTGGSISERALTFRSLVLRAVF